MQPATDARADQGRPVGSCVTGAVITEREPALGTLGHPARREAANVSLDRLARDMSMSARTLQRKLKEKGLSHRELVDSVRREAAIRLLGRDGVSAAEVADKLAFADPASFSRAFVRWTGTTPGAFRDSKRMR